MCRRDAIGMEKFPSIASAIGRCRHAASIDLKSIMAQISGERLAMRFISIGPSHFWAEYSYYSKCVCVFVCVNIVLPKQRSPIRL